MRYGTRCIHETVKIRDGIYIDRGTMAVRNGKLVFHTVSVPRHFRGGVAVMACAYKLLVLLGTRVNN